MPVALLLSIFPRVTKCSTGCWQQRALELLCTESVIRAILVEPQGTVMTTAIHSYFIIGTNAGFGGRVLGWLPGETTNKVC